MCFRWSDEILSDPKALDGLDNFITDLVWSVVKIIDSSILIALILFVMLQDSLELLCPTIKVYCLLKALVILWDKKNILPFKLYSSIAI